MHRRLHDLHLGKGDLMATDVKLDEHDGNWVVVEGKALKVSGSDLMLDEPSRRSTQLGLRRALVHDQNDGLTINFNRDYPGGVTINDVVALKERWGAGITIVARSVTAKELIGAGNRAAGVGAAGSSSGRDLLLRGEVLIEKVPSARTVEPISQNAEPNLSTVTEPMEMISLQATLEVLEKHVTVLFDRIAALERCLPRE
jgi:hypothetical protein